MLRTAALFAVAIASTGATPTVSPVAQLREEMAEMNKQNTIEKAALEAQLEDLQRRFQSMDATLAADKSRKLYYANYTDETDSDLTGNMGMIPEIATTMSTAWIIYCGSLVFLMNAGFALLESGACRAVSCQSVFLKNLLDACFGTLIWFTCGFSFLYGSLGNDDGTDNGGTPLLVIGGLDNLGGDGSHYFFGDGMVDSSASPVVQMGWVGPSHLIMCQDWFFQWAFCVAAATIVSGGVAERLQMGGYLVFTGFMTGFIYPTVGAMTWGYGFLSDLGYSDFAGSGIVHLTGGVGALVGAALIGPRAGRFDTEAGLDPNGTYAPHNIPNVALGTFLLWFGWYGFNCGSTLYMAGFDNAQSAALVAVNTTLCAASGGVSAMFLRRFVLQPKAWNVTYVCGGILGGLVSITAGCGSIHPRATILVGLIGGAVYCGSSELLQKLKIDDPVEAFPVHGACGIWGVMAVPLFDINNFGVGGEQLANGNTIGKQIMANMIGWIVIFIWTAIFSALMFSIIKATGFLKVEKSIQEQGIDNAEFSPKQAYKGSTWDGPEQKKVSPMGE